MMRQSSEPYDGAVVETLVLTYIPDVASMRSPIRIVQVRQMPLLTTR
jgi:hypothetical protein